VKKILSLLIGVVLIIALGLTGAGCELKPTPPVEAATGTVEVRVTDAPPGDNVTGILVTASKLEIHKAVAEQEREQEGEGEQVQEQEQQQAQVGEGEWISINITDDNKSFDLLKIKGLEDFLAASEVAAGKYTQVRLTIEKIEVALGGGEPEPATVPSGELKFVRPFDVVAGETTVIVVDFDADKSVVVTGSGKIMVKPVVKLIVRQEKPGAGNGEIKEVSQEESQQIAEDFVRNSPTFQFDGMAETLKLVETQTMRCPYCWTFVFEFESQHAGYGDRTGQMLAQVITPHRAVITLVEGEVTRAIMDEKWDMIEQKELSEEEEEETEEGKQVAIEVDCDDFMELKHISQEVKIALGDSLMVTLCSNPSTGFQWTDSANITDPTVLEQTDHEMVSPGAKGKKSPTPGAAGTEVWTFKTLKTGQATIYLEYSRPWEGGEKGEWTFTLTVTVK